MASTDKKAVLVSKRVGKNISGAYKMEKKLLLNKLDELDKKAVNTLLEDNEVNLKHVLNERLAELLREEEPKWYQRVNVKQLLEGDANTKYYHLVANGRHSKTRIFSSWKMEIE